MMNKKFKTLVRNLHLWLGLATGLIVLIISLTGCIFVFEEEIREATQKDFRYVKVPPAKEQQTFAGVAAIVRNFQKLNPEAQIKGIRINEQRHDATVAVTTSKKEVYYFNPFDASLVRKSKTDWLDVVQHIHTSLLLAETGEWIIRWSVVIFVIMLLTGLVLWFPNQMRLVRQSLTIKRKASAKRLNYDLHNVLGFYASWVLIIIASSGLYFAFKEVKTAASMLTGTKLSQGKAVSLPAPRLIEPMPERYERMYQQAMLHYPGPISTAFSLRGKGELRVRLIYPYKWARNQNTFYFEEATGKLLRSKLFLDFNGADLIEATNYDLHTGRLFGFPGKVIAFIAALISASLPITGFIIWWKKGRKKKPSKSRAKAI